MVGLDDAHSNEFDPGVENPVIIFMPEINPGQMGGTMRLGLRPTVLQYVSPRDCVCLLDIT